MAQLTHKVLKTKEQNSPLRYLSKTVKNMRLLKIMCLCIFANFAFGQGKLSPEAKKKSVGDSTFMQGFKSGFNKKNNSKYKRDSTEKGLEIFHGWKVNYHDNINYSKVDFDDSEWDTTSTNNSIKDFPEIEKNRIGWFRKKIVIDSSMVEKPYIMKIMITGAAEIYLNGKLINEIGKVNLDDKKAKTIFNKTPLTYSIYFKSVGEQTLAVRFLFTPHSYVDEKFDITPLSLSISNLEGFTEKQLTDENRKKLVSGIGLGIFMMMAFIHFFFFYFFRSQRYNLSFCISMLLFGIHLCLGNGTIIYENFNNYVIVEILANIIYLVAHILLLNAVYEYLQYPKRILFWGTIIMLFLMNILTFLQIINELYVLLTISLLISNYAFLIWKSMKNKTSSGRVMRNAIFTFLGSMIFSFILIFALAAISKVVGYNHLNNSNRNNLLLDLAVPIVIILFFVGPQLSVSGAISFSLAKEFVKTNISLSQKLEEIEKLSEEKQHILSTQNEYLEKQVTQRTAELNQSLENLKITQNQLIQSEKLASLGELTAGIAHEIQNPLNFVNNFSEMSVELAQELTEELDKELLDKALVEELLGDLIQNQEKISHHGKRASSIVKGMLEHSRSSSNVKELTDINALADEYLRLSYHGLRAKDKTFNANLKTDFDENIEKVNIVSQDIGRVILNLITNAFYAVNEKKKDNSDGYEPTVSVSSKQVNDKIELKIKDNGNGIPEKVLDKIFQPFFTTKPTGQGTGLGLSLSYDIVKAHGGELKVETSEGEFTEFTIILPQKTA
jgi:two-component system, NtrC family, sensor kinase